MMKELAYVWVALSALMVVIPLGWLLWNFSQKTLVFLNKKSQTMKENREIKEMKADLEDQQDEFITSSEYGSFVPSEEEETSEQQQEQEPEQIIHLEPTEKDKKRFETLLLEAMHLKNAGKFEEYERKLIEAMAID